MKPIIEKQIIEKPILDSELIDQLREIMEDDFSLLLETYLVESQLQLSAVESSHAANNSDQLSKDAHRLKGSCSNIGAVDLAKTCADIEADPSQDMSSLFTQLHRQFNDVQSAVQDLHQAL
jgi:HPt (histidine-containing phosphotransfer) domain-containing protein